MLSILQGGILMLKSTVKDGLGISIEDDLLYLLKVESAVGQMIKLGEIDKGLFKKYYEEVEE